MVALNRLIRLSAVLFLFACDSSERSERKSNFAVVKSPIEILFDGGNSNAVIGDSIRILVRVKDSIEFKDNIKVYLNNDLIEEKSRFPFRVVIPSEELPLGRNGFRISISTTEKTVSKTASFNLFSNTSPVHYSYRVNAVYDHDKTAYTQGLFYHNGMLFEGTGQIGISSLRMVNLENGKVLKRHALEKEVFGEGIVFLNDQIFQLTWNSQVCFVYNAADFSEIRKLYYKGEGWGLTTDSVHLIRSNGSNKLFFHNADDFSVDRTIEVYTDKGPVNQLNELEYIGGKIFANVYQSDDIVIINPKNGMVEGIVNVSGLLANQYRKGAVDVLNGIAYDSENERIFLTGKYWPKLFEIALVKKTPA